MVFFCFRRCMFYVVVLIGFGVMLCRIIKLRMFESIELKIMFRCIVFIVLFVLKVSELIKRFMVKLIFVR